jgi:hypothetical protein
MSILPVSITGSAAEIPASQGPVGAPGPAPGRHDSGTPPNPEPARPPNVSSLSEVGEDEVQVQRDSQNNGEIVVRYVDHSGNLILQMPTQQVLNVTRAIEEDLEREQQALAKVQGTIEGHEVGKSDGN